MRLLTSLILGGIISFLLFNIPFWWESLTGYEDARWYIFYTWPLAVLNIIVALIVGLIKQFKYPQANYFSKLDLIILFMLFTPIIFVVLVILVSIINPSIIG